MNKERILKQIGLAIRNARLDNNLTQKALADKLGLSMKQIQRYEWGENKNPPLFTLIEIYAELGIVLNIPDVLTIKDIEAVIIRYKEFDYDRFILCSTRYDKKKDVWIFECGSTIEAITLELCGGIAHEFIEGDMDEDALMQHVREV